MNKGCGNCLYHGDSKADNTGARIFCMYDTSWHPDVHSCDKWSEFASSLSKDMRLQMAIKLKDSETKPPTQLEKFPFKPDSVKQSFRHEFEDGDLDTDGQIKKLISLMFECPEREFFFFHNTKVQFSPKLRSAEKENIILLNEVECFYYKHPKHKKDYIKISGNNPKFDWQKELIKNGPEFHCHILRLTQKAKRDLEISYKNYKERQKDNHPFELKPNIYGIGVDLRKVLPWVKKKFKRNT